MVLSGFTFPRVVSRTVFALLALVLSAVSAAESGSVAGTLPEDYLPELREILARALQQSPETIARQFERLAAEARVIVAKSPRLPQLGGNFNYGVTETATATQASTKERNDGFFYNLGVNQALFHWGALKNQHDAAKINLLVQEKQFAVAYRELSLRLRAAYLALIVEKARLQATREGFRLLREDLTISETKMKSGSISAATLAGEQLRFRETELEVNRAEALFATNRRKLAQLAGIGDLPEDKIPAEIPRPAFSEPRAAAMMAELLRDHAKSTIEHEIYDLRLREAVLRQKIEAVRLLPKFGANAGYSIENTTNVNGNLAEQRAVARQTIAIGGSWNIFDGLETRGRKREALVAKRALEQQKSMRIDEILQSAQTLERTLQLDAQQLEFSDTRQAMAVDAHKRVSEEAGFGLLPRGQIGRANLGILEAQARNMEARATFLSRWSEFVSIAGDDPALENISARYAREKK